MTTISLFGHLVRECVVCTKVGMGVCVCVCVCMCVCKSCTYRSMIARKEARILYRAHRVQIYTLPYNGGSSALLDIIVVAQ